MNWWELATVLLDDDHVDIDDEDLEFTSLDPPCEYTSLLTFPILLDVAKTGAFLSEDQIALLAAWREDPFGWGEKHGFPKVEKS